TLEYDKSAARLIKKYGRKGNMMKWKEQLNATVRGATRDCTNHGLPAMAQGRCGSPILHEVHPPITLRSDVVPGVPAHNLLWPNQFIMRGKHFSPRSHHQPHSNCSRDHRIKDCVASSGN